MCETRGLAHEPRERGCLSRTSTGPQGGSVDHHHLSEWPLRPVQIKSKRERAET